MTARTNNLREPEQEEGWLHQYTESFKNDPEYVAVGLALQFIEEILEIMEAKGISRSQLAERMGVSRAYVTRLLDAPPNLTLKSICQVAMALGAKPEVHLVTSGQLSTKDLKKSVSH